MPESQVPSGRRQEKVGCPHNHLRPGFVDLLKNGSLVSDHLRAIFCRGSSIIISIIKGIRVGEYQETLDGHGFSFIFEDSGFVDENRVRLSSEPGLDFFGGSASRIQGAINRSGCSKISTNK